VVDLYMFDSISLLYVDVVVAYLIYPNPNKSILRAGCDNANALRPIGSGTMGSEPICQVTCVNILHFKWGSPSLCSFLPVKPAVGAILVMP
jgi:hypothetical protein